VEDFCEVQNFALKSLRWLNFSYFYDSINIKKIADFAKRKGKSLKEILNMITVAGSQRWNERGILARIANTLC
jgi:hypothetical protein